MTRALSTAFGLMMAAAAGVQAHGLASVAAALAAVAVLAGHRFRLAATLAVLLAMRPSCSPMRHPCWPRWPAFPRRATWCCGTRTAHPPVSLPRLRRQWLRPLALPSPGWWRHRFRELPWLPLLAPLAVFGIYALATRPFLGDRSGRRRPDIVRLNQQGVPMPIDPTAVGARTEPQLFEWTDRDTLLYALGVGAGTDDLAFTTENSHDIAQQVLPTYAVIACSPFAAAVEDRHIQFRACCCTDLRRSGCSSRCRRRAS